MLSGESSTISSADRPTTPPNRPTSFLGLFEDPDGNNVFLRMLGQLFAVETCAKTGFCAAERDLCRVHVEKSPAMKRSKHGGKGTQLKPRGQERSVSNGREACCSWCSMTKASRLLVTDRSGPSRLCFLVVFGSTTMVPHGFSVL